MMTGLVTGPATGPLGRWLSPFLFAFMLPFAAAVVAAALALDHAASTPLWLGASLVAAIAGGFGARGLYRRLARG